jgi:hypothetical protein
MSSEQKGSNFLPKKIWYFLMFDCLPRKGQSLSETTNPSFTLLGRTLHLRESAVLSRQPEALATKNRWVFIYSRSILPSISRPEGFTCPIVEWNSTLPSRQPLQHSHHCIQTRVDWQSDHTVAPQNTAQLLLQIHITHERLANLARRLCKIEIPES